MTEKVTRRRLLKTMGVVGMGLMSGGLKALAQSSGSLSKGCSIGEDKLQKFAGEIKSGGVPPDGIPPIDDPNYVPAGEAQSAMGNLLNDDSVIFGLSYEDKNFAYPQIVMVWHEIVNEEINGQKLSITYCPLTGSAVGYKGKIAGKLSQFGTSGKLLNSNLVMYDRLTGTDSYWPQILGRSVQGAHLGERLSTYPVIWTTWGNWKEKHPDTSVMTADTGYIRSYGNDPYGSYQETGTYYQEGGPMYGVMESNDRFSPKKIVTGLKVGDCALAVPKEEFRGGGPVNLELGGKPVVVVYEKALDTVRAFSRRVAGEVKEFARTEDELVSRPDGTSWNPDGTAVNGELEGEKLEPVTFFDVMWFAWYGFYPGTEVLDV